MQFKPGMAIWHIYAPNIDFGFPLEPPYWGTSDMYSLSIFLSRNKKK